MQTLKVKKLSEDATIPTKSHPGDAGFDLYASRDIELVSGQVTLVPTNIAISLPKTKDDEIKCYGRIAPRSGLSLKGINVYAGVVDEQYRGEIKVALLNNNPPTHERFFIRKGDRIAQLIPTLILTPEVEEVKELDETQRGEDGFGSTGK